MVNEGAGEEAISSGANPDLAYGFFGNQFVKDHREGRFKISARACSRVASVALFIVPALLSRDIPRLLSFASDALFRCELSAA